VAALGVFFSLAVGLCAPAGHAASPTTAPLRARLVDRKFNWGYWYWHYRHIPDETMKAPGVLQPAYDFLVRLPLLCPGPEAIRSPAPVVMVLHARGGDFNRHERRWPDHIVILPDDNTRGLGHTGWFGYHDGSPAPPTRRNVVVPYTVNRLLAYLRFVVETFHADPNRMWVTGASMGGAGALLLALHHPEWVTGCVAMEPPIYPAACDPVRQQARRLFGPPELGLKVLGTDMTAWEYLDAARWIAQTPGGRAFIQIEHGLRDARVPFAQYRRQVHGTGSSMFELFERGAVCGRFLWDQRTHSKPDPMRGWFPLFAPLADGSIRLDRAVLAFGNASSGPWGPSDRPGQWHAECNPSRDPRGIVNAFLRWDGPGIVDEPERLEVSLWLNDEGPSRWRCPVNEIRVDVSPRGTQQFVIPLECAFRYTILPTGHSGQACSDSQGVLTIPQVPVARGRTSAVRLRIEHDLPGPVLSISSPSHPTPLPRAGRTIRCRWRVVNSWGGRRVTADQYACWIARKVQPQIPPGAYTQARERSFTVSQPGRYYLHVRAHNPEHGWGPVTVREVNIDNGGTVPLPTAPRPATAHPE